MKIERILTKEEAASILEIEDIHLTEQVPCSKAEWVQWLVENVERQDFIGIWGIKEGKKVKAYLIALNGVFPPISRSVYIFYQSFYEKAKQYADEVMSELKAWAKSCGASKITIYTKYPRVNSLFGFKPEKGVSMVMEL